MFSLLASVCVFFYYLYQLLFRTKDWRTGETYTPTASRKNSANKLSGEKVGGLLEAEALAAAAAAAKKRRMSQSQDSASGASAPPTPSKSLESSVNSGASATTPKKRISQAELVAEMEKKIDELKRRGDLRKQLLKEVIAETLAAAEDVDDDDEGLDNSSQGLATTEKPSQPSALKEEPQTSSPAEHEVNLTLPKSKESPQTTTGGTAAPSLATTTAGSELRRRRATRED